MHTDFKVKAQTSTFVNNHDLSYRDIREVVPDHMIEPQTIQLLKNLQGTKRKYVDNQFDHADVTKAPLFGRPAEPGIPSSWRNYEFKTCEQLFPGGYEIFKKIEPNDIKQGELGDCYFLCALSALAERPRLIDRLFDVDFVNPYGFYAIWLNINGIWKHIILDDYLPSKSFGNGQYLHPFAQTSENEIWPMLMEKAYAKAYGSYKRIDGGDPVSALRDLTGAPCMRFKLKQLSQGDMEDLWTNLYNAEKNNYIMCTSTPAGNGREAAMQGGLYAGHAYSVISVLDAEYDEGGVRSTERIVQIRNPWGHGEWTGLWRDNSLRWKVMKSKGFKVEDKDDGVFWMSLQEFTSQFEDAGICMVRDEAKYNALVIPAADRTVVRFKISTPGQYTFSVDQKDLKSIPALSETSRKITYSNARIILGKIDNEGKAEYISHKMKFDQNVWVDSHFEAAEYVAILEIYYREQKESYVFSGYGPEFVPMSIVQFKSERDSFHLEYAIWNSLASNQQWSQSFRNISGTTSVLSDNEEKLHIYRYKNNSGQAVNRQVHLQRHPQAIQAFTTYSPAQWQAQGPDVLYIPQNGYGVVVVKPSPNYVVNVSEPKANSDMAVQIDDQNVVNAVRKIAGVAPVPPTRERIAEYNSLLTSLNLGQSLIPTTPSQPRPPAPVTPAPFTPAPVTPTPVTPTPVTPTPQGPGFGLEDPWGFSGNEAGIGGQKPAQQGGFGGQMPANNDPWGQPANNDPWGQPANNDPWGQPDNNDPWGHPEEYGFGGHHQGGFGGDAEFGGHQQGGFGGHQHGGFGGHQQGGFGGHQQGGFGGYQQGGFGGHQHGGFGGHQQGGFGGHQHGGFGGHQQGGFGGGFNTDAGFGGGW